MENGIELTGVINSDFVFSHENNGENFYKTYIDVSRTSGTIDTLPLLVSDRLFDLHDLTGKYVYVIGTIRTYNKKNTNEKTKLIINVFVDDIQILDINKDDDVTYIDTNNCCLRGFVCKNNGIRTTPFGRSICDIILAVNSNYSRSHYIPCVVWGRNAKYVEKLPVGTETELYGRLQSRKYEKNGEERIAYEMSVQSVKIIEQ